MELLGVFVPMVGLMVNAIVQVSGVRFVRSMGMLRSIFLGFGAGIVCVMLLEMYVRFTVEMAQGEFWGHFVTNIVTYGALGYCYFHFVNLGETGRRVRLVRELHEAGGALTLGEILERYGAREIVSRRLDRLVGNGQVIFRDGRYYAGKPMVLMISRLIVLLKLIILGKGSEFD